MREVIKRIPIIGYLIDRLYLGLRKLGRATANAFPGSEEYWQRRYAAGGNSGEGSYGQFAEFKAEIINKFVESNNVGSVIEFGCGDGNQLTLANYPKYLGIDVSSEAISLCEKKFRSDDKMSFKSLNAYANEKAELSLSLDVIYHLIEDEAFEHHMRALFSAATRYIVIYSSNVSGTMSLPEGSHVKHRQFTKWIDNNVEGWKLSDQIENRYPYNGDHKRGTWSDFYIYERDSDYFNHDS
jgi:hypothetical protein